MPLLFHYINDDGDRVPLLKIDGKDVSRRLISCHAEMTANNIKDPGKYDLVLSNVGGVFYGAFSPTVTSMVWGPGEVELFPKRRVFLQINNRKSNCRRAEDNTITIFSGEIQKVDVDEMYCRIEGSCSQGGWISGLVEDEDWGTPKYTNTQIVNTLLDRFEFGGVRHIFIPEDMNKPPEKNPNNNLVNLDLDTALNIVAQWSQCIYFLDENDEFWFIPPVHMRNAVSDLDGKVLRGSMARNGVGYANAVTVFGGSYFDPAWADGTEPMPHDAIVAHAKADETIIAQYGLVAAPALYYPDASKEDCIRIAKNLIAWYDQNRDVPQVKVVGEAPGIWTLVQYSAWNQKPPRIYCPDTTRPHNKTGSDYLSVIGPTTGLISRRIVDISVENGFTCTLEICRHFQEAGTWGKGGVWPSSDSAIIPYPGVTMLADGAVLLEEGLYNVVAEGGIESTAAAEEMPDAAMLVYNPDERKLMKVSLMERETDYRPDDGWYRVIVEVRY